MNSTLATLALSITDPPPTARNASAPRLAGERGDRRDDGAVGVLGHLVEDRCQLKPAVAITPSATRSTSPVARITRVGDQQDAARALLGELEAGGPEQVAPGDHPGRRGELVEVLEARHLAVIGGLRRVRLSARSLRPAASSCAL